METAAVSEESIREFCCELSLIPDCVVSWDSSINKRWYDISIWCNGKYIALAILVDRGYAISYLDKVYGEGADEVFELDQFEQFKSRTKEIIEQIKNENNRKNTDN